MFKAKTAALVFLLMLALATAFPTAGPAQAAGPEEFTAGGLALASLTEPPQPAGASGRNVTRNEMVVVEQLLSPGWDLIDGGKLVADHVSNTTFGPAGYSGTSHGNFWIYVGNNIYQGSYQTKIFTDLGQGCLVRNLGTWSMNSGSAQARGTLDVCLWYPTKLDFSEFAGYATMNGQHN